MDGVGSVSPQRPPIPVAKKKLITPTPSRCSRRLEEKRGGQDYRVGDIATSASKRKAALGHLEPDTSTFPIDVINLLPDDILISLANTCDIKLGSTSDQRTRSLDIVRNPNQTDAQSITTARPSPT